MKFRTSFQASRSEVEHRKQHQSITSSPVGEENFVSEVWTSPAEASCQHGHYRTPTANTIEERFHRNERPASKKRILQNLFRGFKPRDNPERSQAAQAYGRRPHTSRQSRTLQGHPSKQTTQARASFDISDDVIERLMGPPKDPHLVKAKSDAFLLKHRQTLVIPKASSPSGVDAAATAASPIQQVRSPVCRQELDGMFRGAPYFAVDEYTFRPRVSFMEDGEELVVESNLDYKQSCGSSSAASTTAVNEGHPLEIPNMRSADGLDPGSVGFEYFLQLPIADSRRTKTINEKRRMERRIMLGTQPERLGLRALNVRVIADRLAASDVLYATMRSPTSQRLRRNMNAEQAWSRETIEDMGEELFATLIDGDLGISAAGTGSVTIGTQIEALQRVLSQEDLWFDLSSTDTRLRLGQILFERRQPQFSLDQPNEYDVLLLQITLAAELFVRYQAVNAFDLEHAISSAELTVLKSQTSTEMEWNLLLAEKFLTNLSISMPTHENASSTIIGDLQSTTAAKSFDSTTLPSTAPILTAKTIDTQRAELLEFAASIRWPHLVDIKTHVSETDNFEPRLPNGSRLVPPRLSIQRPVSGMTIYHTPPTSPGLPMLSPTFSINSNHSYFTIKAPTGSHEHQKSATVGIDPRACQAPSIDPAQIKIEPWISQHWLSGLVLPGESASSLLIGTVLETSPPSFWALGPVADLRSGFVYKRQGFWSKESVVGRVMAAGLNVVETMHWISIPQNLLVHPDDGWKSTESKSLRKDDHEPRLRRPGAVSKASDPLYGQPEVFVQTSDFTTPIDSPPIMGNEVRLHGLSFTKPAYGPATAQLTFSSPNNIKIAPLVLPLTHDVYFVASYPCQPPPPLPSPNSLTRTLTGSSKIENSNAHISHHRLASAQIQAIPARSPGPASRPSSSGGQHGQRPLRSRRSSNAISGRALTSRPSSFYESDSQPAPGQTTKVQPPTPPALNRRSSFDEPVAPSPGVSKKPSPLNLSPENAHPSAHPLHVGYTYTMFPAATILTAPPESLDPRALSVDLGGAGYILASRKSSMIEDEKDIMVLDCRGSADLEVLARAWCSKIGEHAVIAKVGRTCLACCVREARGLGIGVVIRV